MPVTRRAVLEELATLSDAEREETTTVGVLASAVAVDEEAISAHIDGLAACELAKTYDDGRVRVTVTGEELLDLDVDEVAIVDPS